MKKKIKDLPIKDRKEYYRDINGLSTFWVLLMIFNLLSCYIFGSSAIEYVLSLIFLSGLMAWDMYRTRKLYLEDNKK